MSEHIKETFWHRRSFLFWLPVLLSITLGSLMGLLFAMYDDLPAVNNLEKYRPNVVTMILDRKGKTIAELYREKRFSIPMTSVPDNLVNAILATEDARFFDHKGVRLLSIIRALAVDIRMGKMAQGGSTITQQLAKQLFLTPKKSVIRKIREALLAIQIEKRYTKKEILGLYLNQIYFGAGAYGVEAASKVYFGKTTANLNLAESAMIAGLPQAPSRYSPLNDIDLARQRRNIVLERMRVEGYITRAMQTAAGAEPVNLASHDGQARSARHFVETVRQYLVKKYSADHVYREGLVVKTTLDLDMQKLAEQAVAEGVEAVGRQISRARLYPDTVNVEAALVAINPKNGAILAMVGGADFDRSQFNRAINAHRQPGSAFKPFIYLTALDTGFSPADIIIDSPVSFKNTGKTGYWKPVNFSHRFYGPVTLRRALENSINVASVKLLDKVGVKSVIRIAHRMGVRSPLAPSLALALGVSEVTPLELTSAYATLANNGLHADPWFIESVKNSDGEVLEKASPSMTDAVRPEVAYTLTNMLEGVVQNGTGRKARALDRPVAGKTGTTNDYKDAWFVGYTPDIATGVWVGLDDNRSMGRGQTGGRTAAPIWVKFMSGVLKNRPALDFVPPEHLAVRLIDRESGKLATGKCRDTIKEVFVEGTQPMEYCRLEQDSAARL